MYQKLLSRKLIAAVGSVIMAVVGEFWPEYEDLASKIIEIALFYIPTQGAVDVAMAISRKGDPK